VLSRRCGAADTRNVAAAAAEPISPELVLVCPELRERALAALPAAPVAVPAPPRRASVLRETASDLARLALLGTVAILSTAAVTLVLTVVADATR
jgi:hypothetical protein